ncbi:hypothetical protein [Aerosakkonema funiforme]|uniref:hypothetical protein n=1 Tax=Aerosakkonema funiforme TaxID=1246630 RepID=UPI0035BA99B3
MSKIIYDVIQRFEVENGVPRLVSTNIQVIQGGEDLLSLAIDMLTQMGFYEKFEEKRTSQYIGYRLKNAGKGEKRYQLVLAQRKDVLYISIPQNILQPHLLELTYYSFTPYPELYPEPRDYYAMITIGKFWVLPSKTDIFLNSINYPHLELKGNIKGTFYLGVDDDGRNELPPGFSPNNLSAPNSYIIFDEDKLFPYTCQTSINSILILKEFIDYFGNILMSL